MSIRNPIPTGVRRFHRNLHKIRLDPIVGMILLGGGCGIIMIPSLVK